MSLTQTGDAVDGYAIKLPGLSMPVELRRSQRAKRITLKVSHTERAAILTLPHRDRLEDAGNFLSRHFDWLKCQIEKLPQPVSLIDGAVIPLRGVPHRLSFVGPVRYMGVVWAEECDAAQTPMLCVAGDAAHAPRRLIDWLRLEARKDLFFRVHHHSANIGIYPKRISVRDQSSRWGSCSSNGNLSFSWRLIFAPSFALDYVAAHEVAHLREMNHGPRFWRVVRETLPEMQKGKGWIKKHGAELHRFNAPDAGPARPVDEATHAFA